MTGPHGRVGASAPGAVETHLFGSLGLACAAESTEHAEMRQQIVSGWRSIAEKQPILDAEVAALEQRARKIGAPDLVLEAAALRAMAYAEAGDLSQALACARRTFRMGRTEKLLESECLAAVILARLRRCTGRPHLATRIASALRRFAPAPWHPWIDWEITMAGGATPTAVLGPALVLQRMIGAAMEGDRAGWDAAHAELQAITHRFAPLAADVQRLRAAIDPDMDLAHADREMTAWCAGADPFAPPPFGLAGLVADDAEDAAGTGVALVVAYPDRRGRRCLRSAAALARCHGADVSLTQARVGRADGIVSALALAGSDGAHEHDLFAAVYGFAYVPALHRGAFDVALHRARARVGSLATIERGDGRIRLVVHAAFVVLDPRSMPATGDRVLGKLARTGDVSAKELADTLGIPLRTVQDSLRALVDEGACTTKRAGRRIVYAIEDTTFQEPTLA